MCCTGRVQQYSREKPALYGRIIDVVFLVIPVVQRLSVDELWGWQKSPAIVGVKSNCLAFFNHSQGAIKHPYSLDVEND